MVFLRRRHRAVLTDSPNPRNYWKVLKNRLKKEGSELVTNCNQLKLQSSDGKYYMQDVLDTKGVLRLYRRRKPSRLTGSQYARRGHHDNVIPTRASCDF